MNEALQAYHLAKNTLLELHGTQSLTEPGKVTFESLDKARAFIAEDKELLGLYQDLALARVEFSDVEAYQNRVVNIPGEGISPVALMGLWPLLNGAPSES